MSANGLEVSEVPADRRFAIYAYIGALVFLYPFSGISGTTISFLLKDRFHLAPDSIALFGLVATIPGYFGFAFGYLRDHWAPFGRRDQGILILVSALLVLLFYFLAGFELTLVALFIATLAKTVGDQFVGSVERGLTSAIGQEHLMSGRLVTVWRVMLCIPGLFVALIGAYLSEHFTPRFTFLLTGTVLLGVFAFSLWRPKAIYEDPIEVMPMSGPDLWKDTVRLVRAPGILVIVAMLFVWNFTPGVGTPILFYLTDTLHGTKDQYGQFNAIFSGFFIPTYLLHGFLCTRMPLNRILWIATIVAVPQIAPLMLIHSASSALWVGIPMGLMGGFATAAYFDLLVRACPAGLQGTAMMLGASVWVLSDKLGDVAGSKIYAHGGFPPCAYATIAIYATLIPLLALVPKHLMTTRDGEMALSVKR